MPRYPRRTTGYSLLLSDGTIADFSSIATEADISNAVPTVTALAYPSLQAAINAVPTSGGTVVIPGGTTTITAALILRGSIRLQGMGRKATVIQCSGSGGITFTGGNPITEANMNIALADLTIRGDYAAGKTGVDIRYTAYLDMQRVEVERFAGDGVYLEWVINGNIISCRFKDNDGNGVVLGPAANAITFGGGVEINSNNGWGIVARGTPAQYITDVHLAGAVIEYNRLGGVALDYVNHTYISGCHFEGNHTPGATPNTRGTFTEPTSAYDVLIGANTQSGSANYTVAVVGNLFSGIKPSSGSGTHISITKVHGFFCAGNLFNGPATQALFYDNTSQGVVISGDNKYAAGVPAQQSHIIQTNEASSSGIVPLVSIQPRIFQSGTAGYTALLVNAVESTTGSGAKLLLDLQANGGRKVAVDSQGNMQLTGGVIVGKVATLPSASASLRGQLLRVEGSTGAADRLYICVKDSADAYAWQQIA